MNKNALLLVIEELLKVLKKHNIKFVLMGGIAASVLAKPRATFDIDGIISISKEKLKEFLPEFKKKGFKFDPKRPFRKIQGLPFFTLYFTRYKTYVDLFISVSEFQKEIIRRARQVKYDKLNIKIISPEDLILVKLQSGREKDIEDVREIIMGNKEKLDYKYLKKWSKKLRVGIFLEDELRSLRIKLNMERHSPTEP